MNANHHSNIMASHEGGSKVRITLFLFVLLMESSSEYSILKEKKFLLTRPHAK